MIQAKLTVMQKIERFFMRFNMCKCIEPKYEVINGVLGCNICRKPAKWEIKSK